MKKKVLWFAFDLLFYFFKVLPSFKKFYLLPITTGSSPTGTIANELKKKLQNQSLKHLN